MIHVVSGYFRSGTSAMMQALIAGGMPAAYVGTCDILHQQKHPTVSAAGLTTKFCKENKMAEQIVAEVEYRDVVGFPGYRVGNDGSFWSCWATNGCLTSTWKQLRGFPVKGGYVIAAMRQNGIPKTRLLHHLVLEAFVGPCPEGMETCHENDISNDNRVENLRWGTRESNFRDRDRNGGTARGTKIGLSKLNDEKVLAIRTRAFSGESLAELAKEFGCNDRNVSQIVLGRTWKHVGGPLTSLGYGNRGHK